MNIDISSVKTNNFNKLNIGSNKSRLIGRGTEVGQRKMIGQLILGILFWFLKRSPRRISCSLQLGFTIAVLFLKKQVNHRIRLELVQHIGPLNAILVRSGVARSDLRIERTLRLRRPLISIANAMLRKCCNTVSPWSDNQFLWKSQELGNNRLLNGLIFDNLILNAVAFI